MLKLHHDMVTYNTLGIGNKSFNQTIQQNHHGITPPSLHHHHTTTVIPQQTNREGYRMKLAEALQERADLNRNIEQLRKRLNSNVLVQEGERTAEEPERLKRELDASVERLAYLISRINLTNSQTKVDGRTLTELIARKDALIMKIGVYKDIVYTGSQTSYRARNTEIKIKAAISVTDWQDEIDKMAKELRLLDNKLQENNWGTELIE